MTDMKQDQDKEKNLINGHSVQKGWHGTVQTASEISTLMRPTWAEPVVLLRTVLEDEDTVSLLRLLSWLRQWGSGWACKALKDTEPMGWQDTERGQTGAATTMEGYKRACGRMDGAREIGGEMWGGMEVWREQWGDGEMGFGRGKRRIELL